jgi:Domain of unknown function (DUF4189)
MRLFCAFIIITALLAALPLPASAASGCATACMAQCKQLTEDDPAQGACYVRCDHGCDHTENRGGYGAVALSVSNPQGTNAAIDMPTQKEADERALENCRMGKTSGGDCRIVVQFRNTCAALAIRMEYGEMRAYGVDQGPALPLVQDRAKIRCNAAGRGMCRTLLSACSPE